MSLALAYCDWINGNDANAGTVSAPFKTITYAQTQVAAAAPIYCQPGIYRETVVAANTHVIGLGLCFIDGEGIRACLAPSAIAAQAAGPKFANFVFRNAVGSDIGQALAISNGSFAYFWNYVFFNCTFYWDTAPVSNGDVFNVTNTAAATAQATFATFYNCTFKNMAQVVTWTNNVAGSSSGTVVATNCIVDVSNASNPFQKITNTSGTYTATNTLTNTASPGGSGGGNVNITTTAPTYDVGTFPNPSLSLTAGAGNNGSYIEQGYEGANIGSYWYPFFGQSVLAVTAGIQAAWTDMLGNAFITDPNYYNGNTQGQAININDSNGNHWEVDTQYTPTATSAAVVTPVMTVQVKPGGTIIVRNVIREAIENTAPAAGSKLVVNSTASATRTGQWRASTTIFTQTTAPGTLAWNDLAFTLSNSSTFTQTVYIQGRAILSIAGY